jgi:hypothetical protein
VDRDDQLEVHKDEAADGAPIVDDSPPRRRRRLAIIAAGTLTGLVLGGLVVLLVDAPRATGSGDNPAVWVLWPARLPGHRRHRDRLGGGGTSQRRGGGRAGAPATLPARRPGGHLGAGPAAGLGRATAVRAHAA